LFVRQALYHVREPRIRAEQLLPNVASGFRRVLLPLAIHDFAKAFDEEAFLIGSKQGIPEPSPDRLDDVPSGATKCGYEFLDDVAVAAHRAVETLQVAVDDEDQIVEFLPRCERDCPQRF